MFEETTGDFIHKKRLRWSVNRSSGLQNMATTCLFVHFHCVFLLFYSIQTNDITFMILKLLSKKQNADSAKTKSAHLDATDHFQHVFILLSQQLFGRNSQNKKQFCSIHFKHFFYIFC